MNGKFLWIIMIYVPAVSSSFEGRAHTNEKRFTKDSSIVRKNLLLHHKSKVNATNKNELTGIRTILNNILPRAWIKTGKTITESFRKGLNTKSQKNQSIENQLIRKSNNDLTDLQSKEEKLRTLSNKLIGKAVNGIVGSRRSHQKGDLLSNQLIRKVVDEVLNSPKRDISKVRSSQATHVLKDKLIGQAVNEMVFLLQNHDISESRKSEVINKIFHTGGDRIKEKLKDLILEKVRAKPMTPAARPMTAVKPMTSSLAKPNMVLKQVGANAGGRSDRSDITSTVAKNEPILRSRKIISRFQYLKDLVTNLNQGIIRNRSEATEGRVSNDELLNKTQVELHPLNHINRDHVLTNLVSNLNQDMYNTTNQKVGVKRHSSSLINKTPSNTKIINQTMNNDDFHFVKNIDVKTYKIDVKPKSLESNPDDIDDKSNNTDVELKRVSTLTNVGKSNNGTIKKDNTTSKNKTKIINRIVFLHDLFNKLDHHADTKHVKDHVNIIPNKTVTDRHHVLYNLKTNNEDFKNKRFKNSVSTRTRFFHPHVTRSVRVRNSSSMLPNFNGATRYQYILELVNELKEAVSSNNILNVNTTTGERKGMVMPNDHHRLEKKRKQTKRKFDQLTSLIAVLAKKENRLLADGKSVNLSSSNHLKSKLNTFIKTYYKRHKGKMNLTRRSNLTVLNESMQGIRKDMVTEDEESNDDDEPSDERISEIENVDGNVAMIDDDEKGCYSCGNADNEFVSNGEMTNDDNLSDYPSQSSPLFEANDNSLVNSRYQGSPNDHSYMAWNDFLHHSDYVNTENYFNPRNNGVVPGQEVPDQSEFHDTNEEIDDDNNTLIDRLINDINGESNESNEGNDEDEEEEDEDEIGDKRYHHNYYHHNYSHDKWFKRMSL